MMSPNIIFDREFDDLTYWEMIKNNQFADRVFEDLGCEGRYDIREDTTWKGGGKYVVCWDTIRHKGVVRIIRNKNEFDSLRSQLIGGDYSFFWKNEYTPS